MAGAAGSRRLHVSERYIAPGGLPDIPVAPRDRFSRWGQDRPRLAWHPPQSSRARAAFTLGRCQGQFARLVHELVSRALHSAKPVLSRVAEALRPATVAGNAGGSPRLRAGKSVAGNVERRGRAPGNRGSPQYLEGARSLRPEVLATLLKNCHRIKVVRLSVSWAEELNLPWAAAARRAAGRRLGRARWTARLKDGTVLVLKA